MTAMDRRDLLQRALFLVGATFTPAFSFEALAQDKAPRLLDEGRFQLLTAVAETMVPKTDTPGATEAGVPTSLDALLRVWARPQRRATLIAELDAIDKAAQAKEGQSFASLTPAKRHDLLAAYDAAALQQGVPPLPAEPLKTAPPAADPNYGRIKQESIMTRMAGPPATNPAYAKLKELIVVLYYLSEPALTTELEYEHAPGKWQPSIPITPTTRPQGGPGAI